MNPKTIKTGRQRRDSTNSVCGQPGYARSRPREPAAAFGTALVALHNSEVVSGDRCG